MPVDTHRIVPAERHPLILKQCEPDPRRKMVGETKTQYRAEAWAKNSLLTSKLLSGPGNNKRQLSNDDKNEKAATSLLGQPTFAKKKLSGLAGIGGKTMDFSSLTTNKLLSTQSCSISGSGKADMMSTNKLLATGMPSRSSLFSSSVTSNRLTTPQTINTSPRSIKGIDTQLSVTEGRSSAKVARIEKEKVVEFDNMETDEKTPDLDFPSYPSLSDGIVMDSETTPPDAHDFDHLPGEKVHAD